MNRMLRAATAARFVMLAVVLALSGCSGASGPTRYDLSGTVSYAGKPVPAGEVSLEPDGSRGNTGPGSMAEIKDGKYQTEPGKGILGGPYVVRIMGFDGIPAGDSSVGTALFPPYETRVDFPREATTRDFAIEPSKGRR